MPIYEYKCCDCCHEFEELVSTHDELPPCPKCQSATVEKLMSASTIKTGGGGGDGDMPDFGAMPPMGGGCGGGGG